MSASDVPLFRTGTGGRRHIRGCSHLVGKPVIQAADTDGEICTLCERELRGEGRRYFASLAEALPEFGAARSNWPLIESHLSGVEHDQVWIVHSGSYIALGRGGRAVAWAGKTYVNPSAETLIELPDYRPGGEAAPPVSRSCEATSARSTTWRSPGTARAGCATSDSPRPHPVGDAWGCRPVDFSVAPDAAPVPPAPEMPCQFRM